MLTQLASSYSPEWLVQSRRAAADASQSPTPISLAAGKKHHGTSGTFTGGSAQQKPIASHSLKSHTPLSNASTRADRGRMHVFAAREVDSVAVTLPLAVNVADAVTLLVVLIDAVLLAVMEAEAVPETEPLALPVTDDVGVMDVVMLAVAVMEAVPETETLTLAELDDVAEMVAVADELCKVRVKGRGGTFRAGRRSCRKVRGSQPRARHAPAPRPCRQEPAIGA